MKNVFCAFLSFAVCAAAFARIGEVKASLENRLLSKSSGAYVYSSPEERLREVMELPYKHFLLLTSKDVSHQFYFKRPDTSLSTNSDVLAQHDLFGWELHAAFQNANSVMEFYRHHGDPITIEELEGLMEIMVKSGSKAYWKRAEHIETVQKFDIRMENGVLKPAMKPLKEGEKPKLRDILPINQNRFIYLEVPEDFKTSTAYAQSLHFKIMEDEQRKAHEHYEKRIAEKAAYNASKTQSSNAKPQKKGSSASSSKNTYQRVNVFSGKAFKKESGMIFIPSTKDENSGFISFVDYYINSHFFGNRPIINRDREIRISLQIPQQAETCLGFDYELSDGSLRAKLYKEGVLFMSSKFDKEMRERMENLYKKQQAVREDDAKKSLSRF